MKNCAKIIVLAIVLLTPFTLRSDGLDYIGIAEKIGNIIFGETTVTPSYSLYTWDYFDRINMIDYGRYWSSRLSYKFNIISGAKFYTDHETSWPDYDTTSNSQFWIPNIALAIYGCNQDPADYAYNGIMEAAAESYTMVMTCGVVTTGMSPPTGPFPVCFKTSGTKLAQTCTSTNAGWSPNFRQEFNVMPYGHVTGVVGYPSFDFAWPFQCWSGDIYLY
jgi:hypothetical protein